MSMTVLTYFSYLLVAVPLTVWVATTLSRNGRVFLADVFDGNDDLADAVNRLLVVGFYLDALRTAPVPHQGYAYAPQPGTTGA